MHKKENIFIKKNELRKSYSITSGEMVQLWNVLGRQPSAESLYTVRNRAGFTFVQKSKYQRVSEKKHNHKHYVTLNSGTIFLAQNTYLSF